jgi:hypothetical protein
MTSTDHKVQAEPGEGPIAQQPQKAADATSWDEGAFETLNYAVEMQFKEVCATSSPELPAARPFRNEFYARRQEFLKALGRSRLFHNLAQAREIAESFRSFLAVYVSNVQAEIQKNRCRHGHPRDLCVDCAAEESYSQAVHEGRV